ncbi:hypothetical protein ACFQY7_34410 [Actinomadura luteofluorescens]|uniref:hypothetical protein n=1 Tax=Actinomadura luteofluorescens TaxID=46163 RepID=UPI00362AE164
MTGPPRTGATDTGLAPRRRSRRRRTGPRPRRRRPRGRRPLPLWARLLCCPTVLIAAFALVLAAVVTHDHFAFPGSDISTVNSAPCGVG